MLSGIDQTEGKECSTLVMSYPSWLKRGDGLESRGGHDGHGLQDVEAVPVGDPVGGDVVHVLSGIER